VQKSSGWKLIMLIIFLASNPALADGDVDAGRDNANSCAGCHGAEGQGLDEYPALAGLDRQLLENGMQEYRTGQREEPMMGMLMKMLTDEDIADLAAYYASLPGKE
jgi:cytochrome c553